MCILTICKGLPYLAKKRISIKQLFFIYFVEIFIKQHINQLCFEFRLYLFKQTKKKYKQSLYQPNIQTIFFRIFILLQLRTTIISYHSSEHSIHCSMLNLSYELFSSKINTLSHTHTHIYI